MTLYSSNHCISNLPSSQQLDNLKFAVPAFMLTQAVVQKTAQRIACFYDLLLELGTGKSLDKLVQSTLERLLEVIPGAERGALLLRDRESERLLLKAYVPPNKPVVNKTLVRRAMKEDRGFISQGVEESENTTGLYVPLLWEGSVLGVMCLDTPKHHVMFTDDDLKLMMAIARAVAMAIANAELQKESQQKTKLLKRLLKNFSPKIRKTLLERAHHGHLRPGGKKSGVTILYADIRGFTRMSAQRDAEDVMDVLNAYLSVLSKIIFKYDGTIDKFIGDEILAVFGSPEADSRQHEKAVKAAWEMQKAMEALNVERKARGEVTCDIGIGIHCGEVLHGFIGSAERIEFTVIGDAVNRASRYCDGARAGEVLISPEVYQRVWEMVQEERTSTETKHEGPLAAYRITGVSE